MRTLASILTIMALAGCSTTHEVVVQAIPEYVIPVEPIYPTIKAGELECLSQDVADRLVERELLRKQFIKDLLTLIKVQADVSR